MLLHLQLAYERNGEDRIFKPRLVKDIIKEIIFYVACTSKVNECNILILNNHFLKNRPVEKKIFGKNLEALI